MSPGNANSADEDWCESDDDDVLHQGHVKRPAAASALSTCSMTADSGSDPYAFLYIST